MSEQPKKMTTIRVSKQVKSILESMGRKGETYEDIILRLIDIYIEKYSKQKKE